MLVRKELINNSNRYLVIDENDVYHGHISENLFFICQSPDYDNPIELYGYDFWHVNKNLIKKHCKQ